MDKKRMTYFSVGFGILLVVVVALLARSSRREPAGIVLPDSPIDAEDLGMEHVESQLNVLAISPETVKPAIATLSRPVSYSRTQKVETFWSGGSGQSISQVSVSGSRTRIDTRMADGSIRHMLLASRSAEGPGTAAWTWYDDETDWTALPSGPPTADLAGRMLTYETVRDLPAEEIAAADYRMKDALYCIYVETAPDSGGYTSRYWVSVADGLLYAAEREWGGEVVYRFTASAPDADLPDETLFLLPDGSPPER
ncbi:MAG: hypothetical protein HFF73_04440 [Oscillospiraceae bacterium]|nr:hypothetical protein [Oscillospiraceae bacterium]